MSYLVIARRFRPQTFKSIVGQEHISRALANAILRDKVAHSLLFTGPRGVGKTTTARVLSKALNCTGREISDAKNLNEDEAREFIEPCGECANCKEIAKGSSLACREIDGASNNSVDSMREVIESLRTLPPHGSKYKIYLIDEVHMLSTSAFNALLKSLEEPPPNTIFIFATTDPQKIPETVISRCQQFDFRRLPSEIIIDNLKRIVKAEKVEVEESVFNLIAKKAQGGMRDAQSALDRVLAFSESKISLEFAEEVFGAAGSTQLVKLAEAVLSSEHLEAIAVINRLFEKNLDIRGFVSDFISIFRALYLLKLKADLKSTGIEFEKDTISSLKTIADDAELFDLQRMFQVSQEVGDRVLQSNYPRFAIEAGISRMSLLPSLRPVAELISGNRGESPIPTLKKHAPKLRDAAPEVSHPARALENEVPSSKATPQAQSTSEVLDTFNPSWIDFVSSAAKLGNPILGQFLKRVSAKRFLEGNLEIEGSAFDVSSLKDQSMFQALKKALDAYSPEEKWNIVFHEVKSSQLSSHSVAAQEEDKKRISREQILREAQEDPLIKSALETFGGSKITGVSPLKE